MTSRTGEPGIIMSRHTGELMSNFIRSMHVLPTLAQDAPPSIWADGKFWLSYWRNVVSR